jgi:uncharacterized protein (DUF983 family)
MDRVDGKTLFRRALRRRCPVCGLGAMFRSHFTINQICPTCHVTFWRDPGEALGAMYFDWIVAMVAFLGLWVALDWLTHLSEMTEFFILSTASVAAVILCYPWSRSMWTVLVYLSGGIERPPLRVLPGGQRQSPAPQVRQPIAGPRRRGRRLHRR